MKLHELLAVEPDLSTQTDTCRKDLMNTFSKKTTHFSKKQVTFKSSKEGVPDKVEQQLALQTTVAKELQWIGNKLEKYIDAGHQIDMANLQAKSDVVLDDGRVLLSDVPVTTLMRLEHRVTELRALIHAIPTLDPSSGFELDVQEGDGIYKAREEQKIRTEKQFDFVLMVPVHDKHPAQVKELMVDKPIGTLLTQEWSSLIPVSEKGDMLDRVEELLRAVKKAKSRGNGLDLDVSKFTVGKQLLDYVIGK